MNQKAGVKDNMGCNDHSAMNHIGEGLSFEMSSKTKSWIYGILSGLGILAFFIVILTIFQSWGLAIYEFKRLWPWLITLAIGFGTQIGLYASIIHDATINRGIKTTGGISGGSMLICCSHYLLNLLPIIGVSALSTFLMEYQKWFFSVGIVASIVGIYFLLKHKREMKGGKC